MTEVLKARVSLNLPASLKAAAEELARRDGVSLNQFISVALAEKLGAQNAMAFFQKRGADGSRDRAAGFLGQAPENEPEEVDWV